MASAAHESLGDERRYAGRLCLSFILWVNNPPGQNLKEASLPFHFDGFDSLHLNRFVAGALVGGALGDTYGRQSIIYMHCMIFIPASISSALSGSWMQLLITRLLVG